MLNLASSFLFEAICSGFQTERNTGNLKQTFRSAYDVPVLCQTWLHPNLKTCPKILPPLQEKRPQKIMDCRICCQK